MGLEEPTACPTRISRCDEPFNSGQCNGNGFGVGQGKEVIATLTHEAKWRTTLGSLQDFPAMADPMAASFPDPLNLGLGKDANHPKGSTPHHRGRIHSVIQSPQAWAVITTEEFGQVAVVARRSG
jgi:hypothetical protein